jgi:hypothetical protein
VVPLVVPLVAATVPVPVTFAVNTVRLPDAGENVPSAGVTDHVGATATELPYASAPAAVNVTVDPTFTCGFDGETVIDAKTAGSTVSVCVPFVYPVAAAVSVGLPADVSS